MIISLCFAASTPTNQSTSTLLQDYCHGCQFPFYIVLRIYYVIIGFHSKRQ